MATTYCDNYNISRQDSAFYTEPYGSTWVATVKVKDRMLEVWCVGDMYIYSEDDSTIRYTSDLLERGITNDAELESFRGEWWNNSWFEFRDYEGEWISDVFAGTVYHSVFEAVANAEKFLLDPEFLAEYPCLNPDYVVG
jgi:hypothetical protein